MFPYIEPTGGDGAAGLGETALRPNGTQRGAVTLHSAPLVWEYQVSEQRTILIGFFPLGRSSRKPSKKSISGAVLKISRPP